tara:strand:- start:535 stop:1206 length:672 start_codon:yes stop_codon:yes gene_type:complete
MYILYGGPFTRTPMTEMVLLEGDIPFELRTVDIIKHEHLKPEFLAINPAGWVPALITPEGETIYEMPAINLFLAERHQLTDLVPAPNEAERGAFLSAYFYLVDELEPVLKRYFYPHRFVVREEDIPTMKQMAFDEAFKRVGVIDQRLSKNGPYHLGERFCLADLNLSFWAQTLDANGLLESCPAVRRCVNLVVSRPRIRAKFEELRLGNAEYVELYARGEGVK